MVEMDDLIAMLFAVVAVYRLLLYICIHVAFVNFVTMSEWRANSGNCYCHLWSIVLLCYYFEGTSHGSVVIC